MTDTRYSDLEKLWESWLADKIHWRWKIVNAAHDLRDTLGRILCASTSPGGIRLIQIVEYHNVECPLTKEIPQEAVTAASEVLFCIRFKFWKGNEVTLDTVSTEMYLPAAVRFYKQEPQFALWDRVLDQPRSVWSGNREQFASEVISELKEWLSYSMLDGQNPKGSIGFIQDH